MKAVYPEACVRYKESHKTMKQFEGNDNPLAVAKAWSPVQVDGGRSYLEPFLCKDLREEISNFRANMLGCLVVTSSI